MSIEHVAAGMAGHAGTDWPWGWAAAAVLAVATVVAALQALHWRRRMQQQLQRDRHLKLALWASGEHFWDYDLQQRKLRRMRADEAAPHAQEITMVIREDDPLRIHPDDVAQAERALREHLRGLTPVYVAEYRVDLAGDGEWLWARVRGRVVDYSADGKPRRLAGTARDITSHRQADLERRIASEVLRSMSEAVAVLDEDFRFISVNPAFTRITGYSEREVLGQPMTLLDHAPEIPAPPSHDHGRPWRGEAWKRRKDGLEILCHVRRNTVVDADRLHSFHVVVLEDITDQKRAEQELRYLANYDTLTSLPNSALLSERLARAIVRARRQGSAVAVLFLDLDRFKDINDSLGHTVGDRVLRAVAERLQRAVGPQHTVARLAGDEFTVVVVDIADQAEAEAVAARVLAAFDAPLQLEDGREVAISSSIGISLFPQHALLPSELLKHADTAMYQSKAAGRRNVQVYSARMDQATRHRATLASTLRKIPLDQELKLVYQPRYSLREQRVVGVEALLRWHSADFGTVSPSQFIPLAEETGLILEIGEWVLRQACTTLRGWRELGLTELCMSVNVSAIQLERGDLPALMARILDETGVPAANVELELTESVVMSQVGKNAATLHACRALGLALAIDDFGTGYSSLAYLKRLPINTLKIDQEFISDLTRDPDDEAITSTIIAMGHSLALNVVAEGVEQPGQLAFLRQHGCDEIQGHLVAPALEPEACLQLLRRPLLLPA
ncbi:putative bifunctional diguanylate cyclase/phosphodiesterase [Xanthomonas graminis]|uniref:putative bifunctional diguanylate cyclase/phosphodiesterase n=1 Tax=Xanthomonas graminis TaxID=3390026 RepID=UPI00029C98F9|nr:EAL domain-containing protein [Xanthomonas translucens]EKU26320.1 two-component system sensor protein [Xanthomonas translucens pv. graminis ART-Xtg29]OAX62405.1 sensor protein [Xanthomonas translucens pv. graminis]SBV39924.1 c-di-GMP phosphodiesterase A [Xanthomonas translucens pv. graminis]SBV46196.1 c-di-GMP phosphodiesterase A [Xanthomonas translucens pv. graminis ART-Xtg29]